jgi:hypothetical protein
VACDATSLIFEARSTNQYGQLSERDLLLCMAQVYCSRFNWDAATAADNAKDYHRLSDHDLDLCFQLTLCPT